MERQAFKNTLEIATNIAVVLVAIAALSTLATNKLLSPETPTFIAGLQKGKPFGEVSRVDYRGSEQTLLIAMNTNCSYCQESLPFYRKLADTQPPGNKSLRIVALFPNKAEQVAKYVRANQFNIDTVADVDLRGLGVSGTPTMILVNNKGEVKNFWLGKLADKEAEEVIRSLTADRRPL